MSMKKSKDKIKTKAKTSKAEVKKLIKKQAPKKISKSLLKAKTKAVVKKSVAKQKPKAVTKDKKVATKVVKKSVQKESQKQNLKSKKIEKKAVVKVEKVVKKFPKKLTKKAALKTLRVKESSAKTSAKIIAKGKTNDKKSSDKVDTKKNEVVEKKTDSQKNVIFTKKLSESRTKIVFKTGDYAVYPSHGVGKIVDTEKTSILGQDFNCYLMYFEKEKLTIKIPTNSAEKIGLRHLASKAEMDEVFSTLRSGIKKLKGMWSRRAQEYETKINSGDIMLLAEVLRDLTRDIEDGERSYSERIIYETAVHRLAAEYSVIYGCDFEEAKDKVISTAKDKLGIEGKITQKDEFDEFDYDDEESENEDDDEEEEEEEEDDEMYDDDDEDEKPKRKKARG